MQRVCIAIADTVRARLYLFEELAGPPTVRSQELEERVDLVNPARRMRPSELLSDTRPGSNRAPSGRGYAVDDRRDAHVGELDRRFAAEIIASVAELIREHGCDRLILVASPKMLGELRKAGDRLFDGRLEVDEASRDLTHLTPSQTHDYLAERGLLPPRERLPGPTE